MGRDKKWNGTIFIPPLYVDFFNRDEKNNSIIFPAGKISQKNYFISKKPRYLKNPAKVLVGTKN